MSVVLLAALITLRGTSPHSAILVALWNMITNGVFYEDLGGDYFTRLNPEKTKNRALTQLRQMGYDVTLNPLPAAG